MIRRSPSGTESYCEDLIEDLIECKLGMTDLNSFQTGVHAAHAFASMYYMERSSGVELRKRKTNNHYDNHAYGYLTGSQKEGQDQFVLGGFTKLSHYMMQ